VLPKTWTMEGSNNGSIMDDDRHRHERDRMDILGWSDIRAYARATTSATAYRYFRLNITANNGDATYTQVAELYLYGTTGGGAGVAQPQIIVIF
jgi:hypothetical protein